MVDKHGNHAETLQVVGIDVDLQEDAISRTLIYISRTAGRFHVSRRWLK